MQAALLLALVPACCACGVTMTNANLHLDGSHAWHPCTRRITPYPTSARCACDAARSRNVWPNSIATASLNGLTTYRLDVRVTWEGKLNVTTWVIEAWNIPWSL